MKKFFLPLLVLALVSAAPSAVHAQATQRPKPTPAQYDWEQQEFYLFAHFGPNTFTGKEWGHGDEKEEIFNPSNLNTDQWCRIAKAAGAKGIIITAKHHDGFCLFPSKYSTHTVRESKWKDGKGDVVKDLWASCKKYGLKFGVYISPWDRNHPAYGTDQYNDVYLNTMKELFANYGPIWELWWDGANGEGPNGKKQQYDFTRFEKTIRTISPNTVIFSDIGPDIRWVGNERGIAGTTNWNTLDTAGFKRGAGGPSVDSLNQGNAFGKNWIPAECDVSIRPGWFYHKEEDDKVKSPEQLFQLYLKSVGRGANLNLNVPPDPRGLISPNDSAALMGFKKLREQFSNNLAAKAKAFLQTGNTQKASKQLVDGNLSTGIVIPEAGSVYLSFANPTSINAITLCEEIKQGQACSSFTLRLLNSNKQAIRTIEGTTIGRKRILTFPSTDVAEIELSINSQHFATTIAEVQAYKIDESLLEK